MHVSEIIEDIEVIVRIGRRDEVRTGGDDEHSRNSEREMTAETMGNSGK